MPSRRNLANAIRALSMDAVQRANSGHPGAPMGMADIVEVLWNDYFKHNPANPDWFDRDRFVMSNGHGSMLLYSLLHLSGYDLPIAELKRFRQLHSRTPGHPEVGLTPGAETTTGPLGQGLANAAGMALAEKILAARFNRPGFEIVNHHTYVSMGDGCLMEGLSHEVCSLAGTLGLGKLICLYDDNGISIDGRVDAWFTDDTPKRFEAYGWHVVPDIDGHNSEAVRLAIEQARAETDRPSILCCKTIIGWGSPTKQGTGAAHGAALGEEEVARARAALEWPHAPFDIPTAIYAGWDARTRGRELEAAWNEKFRGYRQAHPDLAAEFERRMAGRLPDSWQAGIDALTAEVAAHGKSIATRKASGNILAQFGPRLPELIGGSADLSASNNTLWSGAKAITAEDADGNYIYFGVREFAMAAIINGMALSGGFIPYGGTFLTFSDYARNALRLAALMGIGSIFIFTHDSIGLGEDGPTHQAIEHLASLRVMPGQTVWRPCDAVETLVAWRLAIEQRDGPSCLVFTRQNVPLMARTPAQVELIARGGYILRDTEGLPDAIVIATGSEVQLAVAAAERLTKRCIAVRVVSMPCTRIFDAQDQAFRESVLPSRVTARVAVEAGVSEFWRRYVGSGGQVLGIDRYGVSAPAEDAFEYFGFTVDNVVSALENVLSVESVNRP